MPGLRPSRDALGEHLCAGLLAGVWLFYVTPASGGLHDPATAAGLGFALPLLLAARAWRHVGPGVYCLLLGTALGGVAVLATTPTGWSRADALAGLLSAGIMLTAVAAYARTAGRRIAVAVVLVLAVVLQFAQAWLPWWGSGNPNQLMIGTFYWHNQLGIFMTALALFAGAIAVSGHPPARRPALIAAPIGIAVVVLSTSRTCLALLLAGWLALLLLAAWDPGRRSALLRWLAVPAATAVLLLGMTSQVFFPDATWAGPAAVSSSATVTSVAGDRSLASAGSNGRDRVDWTVAAVKSFRDKPLLGSGFDSFLLTSPKYLAPTATASRYAHNGPAEVLSAGGLALGLPVLLAVIGLLALCVRTGWRALRPGATERAPLAGAALGVGVLMTHALVDFDWQYPTLLALTGALGGIAYAAQGERSTPITLALPTLIIAVAIGGYASRTEAHGRQTAGSARVGSSAEAERLLAAQWPLTRDPRLALAAARASLEEPDSGPDRLLVSTELAERVLDETAGIATLDQNAALLRAEISALAGRPREALTLAEQILEQTPRARLFRYPRYLQIAHAAGEYEVARGRVISDVVAATPEIVDRGSAWRIVQTLTRLDAPSVSVDTACAAVFVRNTYGPPPSDYTPPNAPPRCPAQGTASR